MSWRLRPQGINVVWIKVGAFAIGAAAAGLSGGLYAHYTTFLSPLAFGLSIAIIAVAYVLVGGLGSWLGPVAGVLFFLVLTEGLRFLGEYRMMIYGIVVVHRHERAAAWADRRQRGASSQRDLLRIGARGPREVSLMLVLEQVQLRDFGGIQRGRQSLVRSRSRERSWP